MSAIALPADTVIERGPAQIADPAAVSNEAVRDRFLRHGSVLLRGFDADPQRMKLFAERFASRFNRDQARPSVPGTDGFVQSVTEGQAEVAPHSEQANSPFRPDAILFCCTSPAVSGGSTLIWDGVEVWRRLSSATRDYLATHRLRFFQKYSAPRWRAFLGAGADLAMLQQVLDGRDDVSYFIGDGDALYLEYLCSPVVRTRQGVATLSNSMLLEYRTLRDRHGASMAASTLTFEDGRAVDEALIAEIDEALAPLARAISWQPGDLVMIDNVRCMHGRSAFDDPYRKIFSSMIFVNF